MLLYYYKAFRIKVLSSRTAPKSVQFEFGRSFYEKFEAYNHGS